MMNHALKFSTFLIVLMICSCAITPSRQDSLTEAKRLFNAGQTDEGFTFLEKAMQQNPASLALSNYYRQQSVTHKRFEQSINFFKNEVEGKSDATNEMYYNLAFAYIDKIPTVGPMGSGFLSKRAIKQFDHVLERNPTDWIATYGIGMNYLHWPDYFKKNSSAMDYLEQARSLQKEGVVKPFYILTYIRLGDAYAKNGKINQAYEIWEEGLKHYPRHQDLVDRYETPKENIGEAIRQLYNPNNSIGEINTDISVLWEDHVPTSLVPLTKNSLQQAGVGGQLVGAEIQVGEGKIGLFSWFMRNLPFLSDKSRYTNVDMSALGIQQDQATHDLASIVAHGMIMGFLSQFEEETLDQARARANKLSAFYRPFFHEGLGMGYAATASLDDVTELQKLIDTLKGIDPNYTRLHLAGAGMWYGLESGNLDKVRTAFNYLGEFGEAYAYEGYGFSQTLFYYNSNPEMLKRGAELDAQAAHSFYHGAGRALWILSGQDTKVFHDRLVYVPERYRADAYSGYGMGVAFTKIETPDFVFSYLDKDDGNIDLSQFLTGVTMGFTIRNLGDARYVGELLASASARGRCRGQHALDVGNVTLKSVMSGGSGDLHSNWRDRIHNQIASDAPLKEWKDCT